MQMEKKISATMASAIFVLLLAVIVLLLWAPTEPVYHPIPEPKSPYTLSDLRAVTQFFIKETKFSPAPPENAADTVLGKVAPLIVTFTGEKYVEFRPTLKYIGKAIYYPEYFFIFEGHGYVGFDDDFYDYYYFYVVFRENENSAEIIAGGQVPLGVPKIYRSWAEEIALENSEVKVIKDICPYLTRISWTPEKYAHLSLSFDSSPSGGGIPERPMATVEVDLENRKVVSIFKGGVEEWPPELQFSRRAFFAFVIVTGIGFYCALKYLLRFFGKEFQAPRPKFTYAYYLSKDAKTLSHIGQGRRARWISPFPFAWSL